MKTFLVLLGIYITFGYVFSISYLYDVSRTWNAHFVGRTTREVKLMAIKKAIMMVVMWPVLYK
jgi:hypothetical protein